VTRNNISNQKNKVNVLFEVCLKIYLKKIRKYRDYKEEQPHNVTEKAIMGEAGCIGMEAAHLVLWLIGLFGIVGVVSFAIARMITRDSFTYDELFVWKRKLPPEARDNN
jgi:hypothetical protein